MALDYLPFMGILIVYSLEALLFLEQRFERTDALPISEREIQNIRWLPDVDNITIFGGGLGKCRSEQRQFYQEYGRETLSHEARAVEVISFLRANRRMSTFRSTLKELGVLFLNTNGKAQNNYKQNLVIGK